MITLFKKLSPVLFLMLAVIAGCKKDSYNFKDLLPTVKSFYTVVGSDFEMGDEVQFKNESLRTDTYSWDFGDGTTSTETNPKKVFPDAGIYTVVLKAVGAGGTGIYSKDITIIDPNAPAPGKEAVYFIEYNAGLINKMAVAAGSTKTLVANVNTTNGVYMAYDAVNDQIYFANVDGGTSGKIIRMDIDGSNATTIVSNAVAPYGIAVNPTAGKIYWTDGEANVCRSNYDGTNVELEFINIPGANLIGLGYSSKIDRIFFYDLELEDLYIANSDGTNVQKLIEGIYGYTLFVDDVNGKIYYDDRAKRNISRVNLDGTNIEIAVELGSTTRVTGMAIDYTAQKLYWSDRTNNSIRNANLDGTGAVNFLSGLQAPRGLFIR